MSATPDVSFQPSTVSEVMGTSVIASSREHAWHGLEVMQARLAVHELAVPGLDCHTVAMNLGHPLALRACLDGRATSAELGPLSVKIIPAGMTTSWQWTPGPALNMLHLSVPATFTDDMALGCGLNPDRVAIIAQVGIHDPQIERIALLLLDELRTGGLAGRLYAESLATVLAVHLLRTHSSRGRRATDEPKGGLSPRMLQQVTAYIEEALAHDLTLAEIAGVVHLSPFHFARLFKRSTGLSPHRYLIARRVERAKDLLLAGDLTIAQVASAVGFADQSHLTRHVKDRLGLTPKQLLRHRKNLP